MVLYSALNHNYFIIYSTTVLHLDNPDDDHIQVSPILGIYEPPGIVKPWTHTVPALREGSDLSPYNKNEHGLIQDFWKGGSYVLSCEGFVLLILSLLS